MSIAQLYDCSARIESIVQAQLRVGTEVIDSRNVSASWLDDWKLCLSTKEEVEKVCAQHLKTKAIRQYNTAKTSEPELIAKLKGRTAKVYLTEVTYAICLENKKGERFYDTKQKELLLLLSMFSQAVDELKEVTNFVKEHYGDDPVAKRFLSKKRTLHAQLSTARDKVINQV